MGFLKGVASSVCHEEITIIVGNAFRLITYFYSIHYSECLYVNLCHIALFKILKAIHSSAFMTIRRDIYVLAVSGKFAIIRHFLGRSHGFALRSDKLHDVRPIYGNGYQIVVNLYYVVRSVAEFRLVVVTKPLVTHHFAIFKVGHLAVVALPITLIQEDNLLLC